VGVHEALIRVPLIVHGAPRTAPGIVNEPVQLADIMPTLLGWAGARVPSHLDGRTLPDAADGSESRPTVAEWYDPRHERTVGPLAHWGRSLVRSARRRCAPEDRVYGHMRALIRYPLKLIWYEDYSAELYDLETDPGQLRDLASERPAEVRELVAELERRVARDTPVEHTSPRAEAAAVSEEVLRQLRSLGYVGDESREEARGVDP
jgi:arylsulfatase A-like enzyme